MQVPLSLQNLENDFDDDELKVEDEDDEQQRQQRIQSLQNQDIFWKSCLAKQANNNHAAGSTNKEFVLYQNQNRGSNPEDFDIYFKKYNGMSAKFIFIEDDDKDNNDEKIDSQDDDDDDLSIFRNQSILTFEERINPKIMDIKLGTMKKVEEYKVSRDNQKQKKPVKDTHFSFFFQISIIDTLQDDEFDTPTPCDDEDNGISNHMKCHSLPKKVNTQSPSQQEKANHLKKYNTVGNHFDKQEKSAAIPKNYINLPAVSEFNTPAQYLETPEQNFSMDDKQMQQNDNYMKAYLEQQHYLQQQASKNELNQNIQNPAQIGKQQQQQQQMQQQMQYQIPMQKRLSFQQNKENSIREMLKSNSTEGYDEITLQQRSYFSSNTFKDILMKGILQDLQPKRDFFDNENYLIILRDVKWNRVYLKKLNMYIQLRIFQSKEQYSIYTDSYKKIVTKFIKFMPQTVYSDEQSLIVIQKLGDFSLYDLSNLILIEAKQHENINYQKYYLQMLSNLFDSLILILFHNYYIGNINSKNVFVSKVQNKFVIKFSNLVDFSFDYSQICDKNYAYVLQSKPTEIEIWFSELYGCCRCMQEMMDRDKYYLMKKNIKEFINRHKGKYQKMMNILSFFLMRNESMKNGVNFDVIQQFLISSFEDSERVIQLSDRSLKHIQYMIQTSKMHLSHEALDLNNKLIEQKMFFFMQQIHFHQDFEDEEMQYVIKFINRMLYRHLFDKTQESDLFYMMLDTLISDASIFRRNKNIQKTTYIIYILYLLKSPQRIEKSIAYWRYMSQTTSLVDQQNPMSLYYVGLFNLFLLDNQKALKYFQYSYSCKNYREDIIIPTSSSKNNNNKNKKDKYGTEYKSEEEDEEENGKINKQEKKSAPKSPIISCKPKNKKDTNKTHLLFQQNNEEDNFILKLRQAYGYLGQLKYILSQEQSVKKMAQLMQESRDEVVQNMLGKLIELELQISQNIKQYILQKQTSKSQQSTFFIEQIITSPTFNVNVFMQTQKIISNSVTLTENLKLQFLNYQSSNQLLYQVWVLFTSQVNIQQYISERVTDLKKISNLSNEKYRAKTFNSFHNLESRSNKIDNF